MTQRMRTALDFGPLLVFLLAFYFSGKDVYMATAAVMVASVVSLAIFYVMEKKVAPIPAFTCVVVVIFGGLTLYFANEAFIMMKPTIVYVAMGCGLFASAITGKNILGSAMSPYLKMSPEGWKVFLTRFAMFCLFAAMLNEVLRRVLTFDLWLNFKVFGFTALFFIFSMTQTPFLMKHIEIDEEEDTDPAETSTLQGSQTEQSSPAPSPDRND